MQRQFEAATKRDVTFIRANTVCSSALIFHSFESLEIRTYLNTAFVASDEIEISVTSGNLSVETVSNNQMWPYLGRRRHSTVSHDINISSIRALY